MTIEEQAQQLEHSLRQLERSKRQQWITADERAQMLHALKAQLTEAERTLNLPATPDTAQARYRLILWSEMARGTLKHLETQ